MPFKSMAQRRKFYALKAEGKMSQKTIDEWEKETPEDLPERLKKTGAMAMNFWAGFEKRAAETYVQAEPADPMAEAQGLGGVAPEKMLKWNELGGVDPRTPEDMEAGAAVGLITLPAEIEGGNCGNCMHFRALNPQLGSGFCTNPAIKQDVTARMLCGHWSHPGAYSAAEAAEEEAAMQEQAAQEAAMAGQAYAEGDPTAQNIMSDFQGGGEGQMPMEGEGDPAGEASMEEGGAPGVAESKPEGGNSKPKPKAKKDSDSKGSDKKSDGKGGHTININVGKEKVATDAFLAGFAGRMR